MGQAEASEELTEKSIVFGFEWKEEHPEHGELECTATLRLSATSDELDNIHRHIIRQGLKGVDIFNFLTQQMGAILISEQNGHEYKPCLTKKSTQSRASGAVGYEYQECRDDRGKLHHFPESSTPSVSEIIRADGYCSNEYLWHRHGFLHRENGPAHFKSEQEKGSPPTEQTAFYFKGRQLAHEYDVMSTTLMRSNGIFPESLKLELVRRR